MGLNIKTLEFGRKSREGHASKYNQVTQRESAELLDRVKNKVKETANLVEY